MFNINDYVVYKRNVCRIKDIKKNYIRNNDYYVLLPNDDNSLTIQVPTNNPNIRKLLKKEEVESIINNIPNIDIIHCQDRLLEHEYQKLFDSGQHSDLIKIIKTTYLRNKQRLNDNKKVGEKDLDYFNKAEKCLYTEFSIVLNMSVEDTKNYVIETVEALVN